MIGKAVRYKARLDVQGCGQPEKSFKDTFAATARFSSIRLLAIAAKRRYDVHQYDGDSAFPQAELDPDKVVFIELTEGMCDLPAYVDCVLRPRKTLYGFKQSARTWNQLVHEELRCSATVV